MSTPFVSRAPLRSWHVWERMKGSRAPFSFELEVTARCNYDCRHCYINRPAADQQARSAEMTLEEIGDIADQAVSLGAVWCLITGGEPLLRPDFTELYLMLKRKGLLLGLFTNASAVTPEHVRLLNRYPPRDLEVTVYGVSPEVYERVTRRPGSYSSFRRGLGLLLDGGVKVRLKAMALHSNVEEMPEIARFCRQHTSDYFRFDPLLNLRYDGDPRRNEEIRAERLSAGEIAAVEQADEARVASLEKDCDKLIIPELSRNEGGRIFLCDAGTSGFAVSHDGHFHLCSSLRHPDCSFDLRSGTLAEAWFDFVPRVREVRSQDLGFLGGCGRCPLVNLCLWCPANAYLETGRLDGSTEYFCQVANARADFVHRSG